MKGNFSEKKIQMNEISIDCRTDSPMYEFIDSCLRHKNEMVIYEAASTIVSLKCVSSKELTSAVNVLQLFISSPKPVLRYAAVRTLNKVCLRFD